MRRTKLTVTAAPTKSVYNSLGRTTNQTHSSCFVSASCRWRAHPFLSGSCTSTTTYSIYISTLQTHTLACRNTQRPQLRPATGRTSANSGGILANYLTRTPRASTRCFNTAAAAAVWGVPQKARWLLELFEFRKEGWHCFYATSSQPPVE